MENRKSTQEKIQSIAVKIAEINADLQTRQELSVLDIDLLRKHVIDMYDEVNQLRLVMKETIDHGPWTMDHGRGDEETRGKGDEEMRRQGDEEIEEPGDEVGMELGDEEDDEANRVRHTERSRSTTDPEPEINIEALTKAENQVEAEAEVEAMVEAIVEEELPNEETLNPLPAEALAKEGETQNPENKLAAAEAKVEADAIKAALNPEEANDLAYKFSNTPIHDLKKAISIAKKFEFINSLFGGNVEKYAYSIHHINNLNTGDEAFTYLHDLRTEWKWDDEDKNFQELANLIRRRYLG